MDYILVAREDFAAGDKCSLRWRGPRRVVRLVRDYVYQLEDHRNGLLDDMHATSFKFYHDPSLNKEAIMLHARSSKTGMEVQHLMRLFKSEEALMVEVCWHSLPEPKDTDKPIQKIYEDVPELLVKLLRCKYFPPSLVEKVQRELRIEDS